MIPSTFQNRRSVLLVAAVAAFIIVTCFSFYASLSRSNLEDKKVALTLEFEHLKQEALKKAEDVPATVSDILRIKQHLTTIEQRQLLWSKVIEQIERTIPKNEKTGTPIIQIRSYNGSEDGTISVSAVTQRDSQDPYSEIALLLRAFTTEPSYKNVFIPSITQTLLLDAGAEASVLSFSMNFSYQKQAF